MAGPGVDLTPFFHAIMQHLARSPGGVTFIAKLGLDPAIKAAWSSLNMSKSKKMATIIDTRPDLFSRFMTERAQPMVKLEPRGFECLASGEIPPLGLEAGLAAAAMARPAVAPAPAASSSSFEAAPSMGAMPGMGAMPSVPMNMNPLDARKLFLRHMLDAVAAKDGCVMDLPQLGSVPEVQQAWKLSGLDRRLKMSDVLKERPDLVMVSISENGSALVALTQLAIMCVQTGEVPDPDDSCPPPLMATKKKGSNHHRPSFGPGPRGFGCPGGYRRIEPYPGAYPFTGMEQQHWGPAVGFADPQSWAPQFPGWLQ